MPVKKLGLMLTALILSACNNLTLPQSMTLQNDSRPSLIQRQNTLKQATTAKTGLSRAFQEINPMNPTAQLYEIDVWHEKTGKSLHYGFLPAGQTTGDALRVLINVETQLSSIENVFQGSKIKPVNQSYWMLDNDHIYSRAQENGLRDQTYLATLWEDTWHISGLQQDLYFQMDAQHGAIKLRCIGPYLDNCTDGDGTPVRAQDQGWQHHTRTRQKAR